MPREKNNELEDKLFDSLKAHFDGDKNLSREEADMIKSFIKRGIYKTVFNKLKSRTTYRGMAVNESWLRTALNLSEKDVLDDKGTMNASFTFTPLHDIYVTSWTSSQQVAERFSHNTDVLYDDDGEKMDSWRVVMSASTKKNNNNFINCAGLYELPTFESFADEQEIMAIGNIKVSKIWWHKG